MKEITRFMLTVLCLSVGISFSYAGGGVNGCTDSTAVNYIDSATIDDGSCLYAVHFSVDMNCPDPASPAFSNSVSVTGPFCGWCATGFELADTAQIGIFEGTFFFPAGPLEYKYMIDGFASQEDLIDDMQNGASCAPVTDFFSFANRLDTISGPTSLSGIYGRCDSCPTGVLGCTDPAAVNYDSTATSDDGSCLYSVHFAVDMSCADPNPGTVDTVFITGPFCSWCATGFPLSDPDSNDIWEGTYIFPGGNLEYKYMVNNFASQENLIDDMQNGASCAPVTDFFSFANRLISIPSITSVSETYGSCSPCPVGTPGCTDPAAVNFDSTATFDDGSCLYNVSFAVDMNCSGETFSTVSVTGPFCNWCASGFELSDPDSNGIYEGTFQLGSPLEYKYMVDFFASQENLIDDMQNGASCAPVTDFFSFANRLISFTADTAVADVYGSCGPCIPGCTDSTALNYNPSATFDDGSCITSINVTLTVDMCNEIVDTAGVFVAGTFNGFDPTATQMMNIGGTVYQVTIQVAPGAYIQYKFLNGPSFGGEETVPGACGVDNGFGAFDRGGFNLGSSDTTFATVAFGACGPCVLPTNVTFIVNMCGETVDSAGVYVAGSFNGFNPSADQLLPIGNDRYSVTLALTAGQSHTYKYLNGPSFNGQEVVPGDCGSPDGFGAFNRNFTVPASDTTIGPVRFGSCSEDCPVCPEGQVAHILSITGGSFPNEIGYSIVNSNTGDTILAVTCGNGGTATDTICLDDSADYCFEAWDDWGDGWNGGTYALSRLDNGALVISGSPNNGMPGDGTDACDTSQLEETTCFSIGVIEGCTDSTAVNYNPDATVDDGSCLYAPSNDDCDNAISIACGDTVSGSTAAASVDTSLGTCGTSLTTSGGVWYTFAGDGSPVTLSTCGSTFDTKLGLFEGSCDSLICIGGNDDFCGLQSQVVFNSQIGATYYIYVTGFGTSTGNFDLTVTCAILGCTNPAAVNFDSTATVDDGSCIFAPVNDSCQNAIAVTCGDTVVGSTAAASTENVPFCNTGLNTAGGVWYTFLGTGDTVTASLCGSEYDSKIGIFEGSCDSLTCIVGNDDFCGLQSQVEFVSQAGTIYYILVTGFSTSTGNYQLALSCAAPAGCATPVNLAAATATGSGTVTLSWDAVPSAGSYVVRGTRQGLGTILSFQTSGNALTLNGLLVGVDHYWQVRAVCGNESSDYSVIDTFNIPPCSAPDSVWTTNVTSTTATANWSPVPDAVTYFVYANRIGVPASGTAVITVSAPTTSISGSGLIPGESYQYAVRARCAPGGPISGPSPIDTFTAQDPSAKYGIGSPGSFVTGIRLYPNPAHHSFNIEVSSFEAIDEVHIAIFDLNGQHVLELNGQTINNNLSVNLPADLVNGVYQIHVRYADQIFNEKLIIVR